jgi:hypothetical protein
MEPKRMLTEEEHQLGEDQMVALVMNLLQNYQSLAERV